MGIHGFYRFQLGISIISPY